MSPEQRFEKLRGKLLAIFRNHEDPIWPAAEKLPDSAILADIHAEWIVHRIAALETVNAASLEVESWYKDSKLPERSKLRAIELPLSYLEKSCATFEAKLLAEYIELASTIAEAAAKISGAQLASDTIELLEILAKIKATRSIKYRGAIVSDAFLRVVEESMRRMLLGALMVETQAGSLTGRFRNYEPVDAALMAAWKKPIVDRIESARSELSALSAPLLLTFPSQGLWPAGLI